MLPNELDSPLAAAAGRRRRIVFQHNNYRKAALSKQTFFVAILMNTAVASPPLHPVKDHPILRRPRCGLSSTVLDQSKASTSNAIISDHHSQVGGSHTYTYILTSRSTTCGSPIHDRNHYQSICTESN